MGRGKIDEEEFTVKIYEILLGIIVLGMTQLSQIQVSVEEYNVVAELDYSDTEVSDVAIEADEQENMDWTEGDEEWADRRTKSNSTLQVTIERTDRSLVNEDGLTIAIIYYDRPVVFGDY